jgi:ABC-type multidrug transport system fused ATPase/permease subunit
MKIFTIMDTPSEIDAIKPDPFSHKISEDKAFEGEIEFKDVWFRYPSRPEQWVF